MNNKNSEDLKPFILQTSHGDQYNKFLWWEFDK